MTTYRSISRFASFLVTALAVALPWAAQTKANAAVVQNGTSQYVIVLPDDAIPAEKTAAAELSDYLQRISGAQLPIVSENAYGGGKMLAVGFNAKLPAALQPAKLGVFGPEEILIASSGDTMLLAGGRPRGTYYAVSEYLHRLGVRWYTPEPDATQIPRLQNIPLPVGAYRFNPPMQSRSQLVGNAPTDEWSAHNRLNSIRLWSPISEEYGGGFGQGPDMHTFGRMLSLPTLQAHPEWMAVVEGKREQPIGHTWGVCLSNLELRSYLLERTMIWARANPTKKGVWIGQNDGSKPCMCEKCQAFYKAHGNQPSSMIVQLLNELADRLKQELPDRVAKTLAYSWSVQPPANMRARDNTIIMFTTGGSFSVPIAQDPERAVLRKAIADWRAVAKNLEVYLYSAPWENYWFVEPSTYSAAQNIQWAKRSGITSIYTHVSGFGNTFGSDQVYLRGWLYARLSWDPSQNVQLLVEDFVRGYYGPAAEAVLKSIKLVHSDIYDTGGKLRQFNNSTVIPKHVNPKTIRAANLILQKAYDSTTDPMYRKRLSMHWIGYLWTDFWLGFNGPGRYDTTAQTWSVPLKDGVLLNTYAKLAKQFMIDNKIDVLKENRALNPVNLSIDKMGVPWQAVQLKSGTVQSVVIPGIGGKITEFRDSRTDFDPLKPYWGFLITEYPVYGSWRDSVNNENVASYVFAAEDKRQNPLALMANAGGTRVHKNISLKDGALHVDLQAAYRRDAGPVKTGPIVLRSAFMLDMQDKGFGDHPTVYVEKTDGTWAKRVLGTETTFWYIAGEIDVKEAAGRIIIAAEKRPEGLQLNFDPAQMNELAFEYDRYAGWSSKDQGRMLWISPTNNLKEAAAGQTASLALQLKILPDAAAALTEMSKPEKS